MLENTTPERSTKVLDFKKIYLFSHPRALSDRFQWHLVISILGNISINKHSNENEIYVQSEIETELDQLMESVADVKKVLFLRNKNYFEHHWYLDSPELDFSTDKMNQLVYLNNLRPISFELKYDPTWSKMEPYFEEIRIRNNKFAV